MILEARNLSEWTGRPLSQHRDQDVLRWAIARQEAAACLAAPARPGGVEVVRVGKTERARASSSVPGSFAALWALTRR